MKRSLLVFGLLALSAFAEVSLQLTDDLKLRLSGDVRARYEGFDWSVINPDVPRNGAHTNEYFRVRTRLGAALDLGEDFTINLRLANRFHYVTTSPAPDNNNGSSTWEFPDEVYLDDANVVFKNLLDGCLTLTVGRQSLMLGNGLLVSEGTPFDQGRSVYFDGVTARFKDDTETVTAFVFYDNWKDRYVFINDKNRSLRSGDTFTAGLYWTHAFCENLNLDTYYMFNDVDDRHPLFAERGYVADSSASVHTAGMRLFGSVPEWFRYSVEAANQFGRDADGAHLGGTMADARLDLLMAEQAILKPILGFELTHFSGDDTDGHRNRRWNPVLTQCPLWGEELLPIMLNGMWSNLNFASTRLACSPTEKSFLTLYLMDFYADERSGNVGDNACTGEGHHVGLLIGANAGYNFSKNLSCMAWISHFMPGDFYQNGHDCSV